jgi:glutamine amidotransferase
MVTIVDYNTGNVGSVYNMLKKIGASATITSDPIEIAKAEKLVICGVGSFDEGMKNLANASLIELLNEKVLVKKTPIIGICLGMQLFTRKSEEGQLPGLGWINADTVKFSFTTGQSLKVPHMGWNYVDIEGKNSLFLDMYEQPRFYFVHSYFVKPDDASITSATANYGHDFCASYSYENILGVQFHPEKSHKYGMKLLKNFIDRY